ncbi:MAG: PcfJ domain-containing protein [Phocaeicola sp.]
MKPRNKFQKEVVELSKTLQPISEEQKQWAYKNLFTHFGRRLMNGKITCMECGVSWQSEHRLAESICGCTCPHCNSELTIKDTRKSKFKEIKYLCIIAKHKEYQVIRFFYIEQSTKTETKAHYYSIEVVQRWIAPNGKYATFAMLRPTFGWNDSWQWSSELELRPEKQLYDIMPTMIYPKMSLIPEVKRNGFKGEFHRLTPFEMFHAILTNNRAETLLKTKQYELLRHFVCKQIDSIDYYWNSIRIAIRNGYIINDGSMWCDYIDLLNYFNRDIFSPKYVCPDNLKLQHDRLVAKKKEQQEREELERKKQKALQDEQRFRELKSKFFGIEFSDGVISVRVMDSVMEFAEEGTTMHHCVFSNEYYLKENSLILSATIDGKRIETIEVSLKTCKVVQSRGICNQNTEYHDQIINLVNKHSKLIRQRIVA